MTIGLPEHLLVDTFAPTTVERPIDFAQFSSACEASGAERFVSASSLLFIVNDGYRHTPTARILDWIEQYAPGVFDRAHFLIATGTHHAPNEAHYQSIFGQHLPNIRPRLHYHVATDLDSMIKVGVDSFGKDVLINKLFFAFEKVIVIGSVEPHYFAGFTGGRKAIFPGICDLATIERNHNLANSLDCVPLRLKGNPVEEHLQSLLAMISDKEVLSIQAVADTAHRIGALFIGSIENSFTRAIEYAEKMYAHHVGQPYDAVICEILPPLDKNLYQAQKAVENCQAAVMDDGLLVACSSCKEGIGSEFFFHEAMNWDVAANRPGDGNYRFGSHKVSRMVAHQGRIKVALRSELKDSDVSLVYYHPIHDVSSELTRRFADRSARIALVRDAAHTVLTTTHSLYSTDPTREKVI
ncbi:MAG: lactate racemase domain-containing protein [candidate division Zixibacteria bacterium]|nr:lactate racemase domain-containing protein [candidate division Zixibacteria bacterium]